MSFHNDSVIDLLNDRLSNLEERQIAIYNKIVALDLEVKLLLHKVEEMLEYSPKYLSAPSQG